VKPDEVACVRDAWQSVRPEIESLFARLWACPELPGMEYQSCRWLMSFLEEQGFQVTAGPGGVPTAFRACRGSGDGPKIGILAEYDALACLDNGAVPYRTGTGRMPGHGCGHNHIGPANSGAGIAAAIAASRLGLPGQIVVIGCPAEEIGWGKIALQGAGVFDDLDAVLTSHGDYQNGSLSRPCHAGTSGEFVFRGDSAHGGKTTARNALKAAETSLATFERLRSESFPEAQLRHVYRSAGVMPGVTPDEVRIWCALRDTDYEPMMELYGIMADTFAACAREEGVDLEEKFVSAYRGYLPNDVLGRFLMECLDVIGPPKWDSADIAWMEELSRAATPDEPFHLHRDIAYFGDGIDYYCQDDGDLSWVTPLGRINWAYPAGVPIHHWAWTALSGHSSSSPGPLMASEALALAAVGLLQRPDVILNAKSELRRRAGEQVVTVPKTDISGIMASDPQAFWDGRW
jgi:aminobenzoyl-glutamate utilization protein B